MVGCFDEVLGRRILKVNVYKTVLFIYFFFMKEKGFWCNISVNVEELKTVDEFKYLGGRFSWDGTRKAESEILQG